MAEISMAGVGGANYVTMQGKLGAIYAVGMAVTLTGANEVGFGVAGGSPVFGIVTKVEIDSKDATGTATDIVLGIQTTGFTESAKMTATAANRPIFGTAAYCNDKGELTKAPDPLTGVVSGIVTATNTTNNTATVRLF